MSKKSTILIIDDLTSSVKMIERFLSEYNLISASSGREGIVLAKSLLPDLILLDVVMPEMTGFEVCEELKKDIDLKDIPVIFLTTCNRKEDIDRSFDLGAFDYITKPISGKALRAKIHAVFSILDRINTKRSNNANRKSEAVDIFVKGMSHNFNNMFGGIIGMSQLLESLDVDEPKVHKYAKMIRATSENGAKLVSQLLEFSQSSDLSFTSFDTNVLIEKVSDFMKEFSSKQAVIKQEFFAEKSAILGDYDKLFSVFKNLAENADEAIAENGEILFKTTNIEVTKAQASRAGIETGAYIKISVCDNGPGVSEDIQNKIFEPFFSTCDLSEANGLGLSEARGIIQGHRGAIEYHDRVGGGSEFFVLLPLSKRQVDHLEKMVDPKEINTEGRILLVDDEDVSLLFAEEILTKAGYQIITAKNGGEALRFYRENTGEVDLVLTDVIMPVMNGFELAEKVKIHNDDVNVIFMSGHAIDLEDKNVGWAKGFIKKPFRGGEIIRIISDALNKK